MKRFVAVFSILAVLFCVFQVNAEPQGKYVNSASARLVKLVDKSNEQGFQLTNDGFSIGGGWLKQGAQNWVPLFTVNLQAGKEYRFLAVGDMDAKDVDLQLIKGDTAVLHPVIVAQDTATAPESVVTYRATTTGRYTVRLRLFASNDNYPSVCIAIMMVR
jgi:hypothetical protein